MFQTVEECRLAWAEKGQHGTPEERLARGTLWDGYYAYLAKERADAPPEPSHAALSLADDLCRASILTPERTVLDIGGGMGDYALAFAPHCRQVTVLDRSGVCLDVLHHRAERLGIKNVVPLEEPWETYQAEKPFDVCFSAMCPAVCSYEELLRMEAVTREVCCLVTVMRGSYDQHRREMMRRLEIVPKGGMATDALQYYEMLYLMGRMPEVKCWESRHISPMEQQAFLERYRVYFRVFGVEEDVSEPFLEAYFAENATGDILKEESRMRQALISWQPGQT